MHEFTTVNPVHLDLRLWYGDVTVTAADVTVTTVSLEPVSGGDSRSADAVANTKVEQKGDTLVVHVPDRGGFLRRPARVRVAVVLPTGSTVSGRLGSADLHCAGVLDSLLTTTGSGRVTAHEIRKVTKCSTGSGTVFIERAGGITKIGAASGDLRVGRSDGFVTARTASGSIHLGSITGGGSLRVASGDIDVDEVHAGELVAVAASGNVSVGIPTGVSSYLDMNSASGHLETDLAVEATPTGGSPAVTIKAKTASGDIVVRRVAGTGGGSPTLTK